MEDVRRALMAETLEQLIDAAPPPVREGIRHRATHEVAEAHHMTTAALRKAVQRAKTRMVERLRDSVQTLTLEEARMIATVWEDRNRARPRRRDEPDGGAG
jgi:hypothetical protein